MCVCVRASSRRWWKHGQWESVPSCLFPNSQTFLVLKCTPSNCVWAKLRNQKTLRKKRNHPIFNVGKSIPKSISMWWHWRNFWGIRFYLLPQFHLFILCLVFFFPSGGGDGFAIPVVVFFRKGLSSDRNLFSGFVSVICGHYINIHGWPEDWEKGCNTHPDLAKPLELA